MSTTPADNKQVVRRLTEAWNDRDREAWLGVHADEVIINRPGEPSEAIEAEAMWEAEQSGLFAAFPDIVANTEGLIAEDDRVLVRWRLTGTHEGEFHGVAPTGTEITYTEWALYRIEDGQAVEVWFISDSLNVFEQLGAIDPPTN